MCSGTAQFFLMNLLYPRHLWWLAIIVFVFGCGESGQLTDLSANNSSASEKNRGLELSVGRVNASESSPSGVLTPMDVVPEGKSPTSEVTITPSAKTPGVLATAPLENPNPPSSPPTGEDLARMLGLPPGMVVEAVRHGVAAPGEGPVGADGKPASIPKRKPPTTSGPRPQEAPSPAPNPADAPKEKKKKQSYIPLPPEEAPNFPGGDSECCE